LQHAYIDAILTRFNFNDIKPSATPIDPTIPLLKSQSPSTLGDIAKMKNAPYREAVGSLMYAEMGTRPDIAFATSTVAQFSENPGWAYWEAVKRIFLGTKRLKLVYGGDTSMQRISRVRGSGMGRHTGRTTGEPSQATFLWLTDVPLSL
jgi:hypothetical protein